MSNSWGKQVYVQVFGCGSITFKAPDKQFKRMKISESIY